MKHNNIYAKYRHYKKYINSLHKFGKNKNPFNPPHTDDYKHIISKSFPFDETKEGWLFYYSINDKWIAHKKKQ